MIRKGLAVAALVIAAGSLPQAFGATSHAATASCGTAVTQINRGAHGPLNCSSNGIKGIVVGDRTPLPLHSMTVTVDRTRITKKLVDAIDGTTISSATAQGEFVVIRVTVKNKTTTPQNFSPYLQTEAQIKKDQYTVSPKGEVADTGSQGLDNDIEPGETGTGDLVYDVPSSLAPSFPLYAALLVVNFGQSLTFGSASQVGLIVLGFA